MIALTDVNLKVDQEHFQPHAGRRLLLASYAAAIAAVDGSPVVRAALRARPLDAPAWICAIGKAAAAMTRGALDWMRENGMHHHDAGIGESALGGLLITKSAGPDDDWLVRQGIEVRLAGHPVPDRRSLEAGRRLLDALAGLPSECPLLFLLSGGASSLVEAPAAGLGLDELRRLNAWLLASGLPIDAVNRVRKSVSRIKGGGLLSRLGARSVRVLAISDVPGDAVSVIGSGLLVPEPDLAARLAGLDLPDWLSAWVARGLADRGTDAITGPPIERVATLAEAKAAAARVGHDAGVPVHLHHACIVGEAAVVGRRLAAELMAGPAGLHVWGGETTVTLPEAPGRGGRNQHLALAAALALAGRADVALLAAGTDGSDGPTEDAGALVDGSTLERAADAGLDAADCLARADAGTLLEASGDLIRTGPTGTNVMDLILGYRA